MTVVASSNEDTTTLALSQSDRRLSNLRNWYSFTWRPLGSRDDSLLGAIASDLKSRAPRITLDQVPDEDRSATRLAKAFSAAGWRVEVTRCDTNHILPTNGRSFAEYWASRPGKLRTTLKRKAKKVETTIFTAFDAEAWESYERIYAASWKPTEGKPAMLHAFAEQEGKAGRLRLGIAYAAGEPIAAQFWTVESGIAYIHKLAHLESHKQVSAGTTLSAALFEHVIDQDRVTLVDFGTGDEPYKNDWMEAVRPRYQVDCLNMRSPRAWLDLGRLALGRLRAPNVPELAREPRSG
uniref:GNAT family N-acetyltransferase n=1 Tax=uncultured Erythrobacter sp. TaxID=263913 RepID=UPI002624A973|nr:GNAT family N-acetyltransferase [uncultured Erythrobacter sp.]